MAHAVSLVAHATADDRWHVGQLGATSSLCYLAVLGPLALGGAAPARALAGCVALASLQLALPGYRAHEVRGYWQWTPAQRLAFNGGAGDAAIEEGRGGAPPRGVRRPRARRALCVRAVVSGAPRSRHSRWPARRAPPRRPPRVPARCSPAAGTAGAATLALTAYYAWRSAPPAASYAGVAGVALCLLVVAVE